MTPFLQDGGPIVRHAFREIDADLPKIDEGNVSRCWLVPEYSKVTYLLTWYDSMTGLFAGTQKC